MQLLDECRMHSNCSMRITFKILMNLMFGNQNFEKLNGVVSMMRDPKLYGFIV
jgi:hypothetical protein